MRQTPEITMRVEVPSSGDRRIARLHDGGAVMVPAVATCTPVEPSDTFPAIEIEIDEHGGRLVVIRATLLGTRERPLNSDAVRNWSLPALALQASRALAMGVTAQPGGGYEFDDSPESQEFLARAIRRRTTVDESRLQEVADVYRLAGVSGVERTLYVSRSQAYRLVKQAREAGLIEGEES
jgi:hypothetical protein